MHPSPNSLSQSPDLPTPTVSLSPPMNVKSVPAPPRPLTFALPSNVPEKRPAAQTNPSSSSSSGGPGPSNNFLNRLSRRLSQSGANLKRKVSKGNKAPVRRASEADKENRTNPVSAGQGTQEISRGTLAPPAERNVAVEVPQDEKPRKGTLKRGLRVSVMRRTKSEGAPGRAPIRRAKPEDSEEQEELVAVEPPRMNENQSEVSSHRGSYFYSNSLGVCWDGRETVHPDAFAFKEYSSNADVLPSPVTASSRVVYASTLSSFPPRPPLRPRTPPQLTPASLIAAEYRASHPKTPSVYYDPDLEITPTNASPTSPSPPLLDSLISNTRVPMPRYSSSTHSSIASSRPSATFGEALTPGLSEDSSTSLESLVRDANDHEREDEEELDEDTTRVHEVAPLSTMSKEIPRFSLVDDGPVSLLHPKPSMVFSEGASTIDTWRDCQD
ncbi:hypothetical protein JCM16303_001411 [Sporobolomyces ruberrimus]